MDQIRNLDELATWTTVTAEYFLNTKNNDGLAIGVYISKDCFFYLLEYLEDGFEETFVQSLHKKLPENIDDVNSVILSKTSGYQPVGKPAISLTDREGF